MFKCFWSAWLSARHSSAGTSAKVVINVCICSAEELNVEEINEPDGLEDDGFGDELD